MVCGICIGSSLALNGAVAHAFNDVFFKGLLFMAAARCSMSRDERRPGISAVGVRASADGIRPQYQDAGSTRLSGAW